MSTTQHASETDAPKQMHADPSILLHRPYLPVSAWRARPSMLTQKHRGRTAKKYVVIDASSEIVVIIFSAQLDYKYGTSARRTLYCTHLQSEMQQTQSGVDFTSFRDTRIIKLITRTHKHTITKSELPFIRRKRKSSKENGCESSINNSDKNINYFH